MAIISKDYLKIPLAALVIFFGVVFRIFLNEQFHIPNFEAVTALSLLSGVFFRGFYSILIPLNIMFFSDFYFGNSVIYLFTWSAFALIGIFGNILKRNSKHLHLKSTGLGILSVLFFYIWTNFGWWLTSNMYSMDLGGLIECYLMAIPFLKNQLLSVLLFVPGFSLIFSRAFIFLKKYGKELKTKISSI
ncbi:MAG: DUF6580 family putative transport protein [Candidatus Nealsonbacteria bacterium]